MKYEWLQAYCLSKKGAAYQYKPEWEAGVFTVAGKMFAMLAGDAHRRPIVSLKCDPVYAEFLRAQHKDIIPGYYMNKMHWNSVYLEGEVPDALLQQLIDLSYKLVLEGLPKKAQKEIAEG